MIILFRFRSPNCSLYYVVYNLAHRYFSHDCGKIPGEFSSLNPVYNVTVFTFSRSTRVRLQNQESCKHAGEIEYGLYWTAVIQAFLTSYIYLYLAETEDVRYFMNVCIYYFYL